MATTLTTLVVKILGDYAGVEAAASKTAATIQRVERASVTSNAAVETSAVGLATRVRMQYDQVATAVQTRFATMVATCLLYTSPSPRD